MADRKCTDLTALAAGSQATGDLLMIVDVSESAAADKNKKITVESLFKGIPGNVGIGTSSPGSKVHVFDSNPEVRLQSSGTSTNCEYSMLGRDGSNVAHKVNIKTAASALTFGTGGSSGNSYVPSERMRIDSSGNVGVGTTSPAQQDGNNNPVVHLYHATSPVEFRAQRGNGCDAFFTARSAELQIGTNTNHRIELRTNDTERMRIESSGIIGLPDDAAIAWGSGSGRPSIKGNNSSDNLQFNVAGSERMRIASDGKIGIGHTTPKFGLTLAQSATDTGKLGWEDGSENKRASITCSSSSDALQFHTGTSDTERMRITSSGMVELRANQGSAETNVIRFTDTDTSVAANQKFGQLQWFSNDASGGGPCVKGEIYVVARDTTPDGDMVFATHDGSGTNTAENIRLISSGGITFNGDTAAANALNDYEEGTWTPTLIADTGIASHNAQNGTYTKIGRLVHCRCRIDLSSKNTLSGNLSIGGLPFTVANVDSGTSLDFSGFFSYFINASSTVYFISVNPKGGATTASLYFKSSSSSGMNALDNLDIDSDFDFRAAFTYYV